MSLEVNFTKRWPDGTRIEAAFASQAATLALFGRSGSGKSTVVNALAGLLRPVAGRIVVDGEVLFDAAQGIHVPVEARGVGYVFQDGLLFPHLSTRQNLLYGARRGAAGSIGFDQVVALLGIETLLERRPATLSGGEKQRVAIGRALLSSPRILLMDEPLASLDAGRRSEILRLIERVRDELKVRIVYVSHSIGEVTRLADDVVLMHQGGVMAYGPVEEIFNRADLRPHTGRFEGGALIEAEAVAHDERYFLTTFRFGGVDAADSGDLVGAADPANPAIPANPADPLVHRGHAELIAPGLDAAIGSRVRIRIRARDVTLALHRPESISTRNVLAGQVVTVEAGSGAISEVRVRVAGKEMPARISRRAVDEMGLQPGMPVFVLIKAIAFDKRSMGWTA